MLSTRSHEKRGGASPHPPPPGLGDETERLADVLTAYGYQPRSEDDDMVILANCPFDSLAREHTELICSANLAPAGARRAARRTMLRGDPPRTRITSALISPAAAATLRR